LKKAEGRRPKAEGREDFVRFKLKIEAPDFVALGGARFSGAFARAREPFEVTRGEWKVFVERTGFFEEIEPSLSRTDLRSVS